MVSISRLGQKLDRYTCTDQPHVGSCRHRVGSMSELVGMRRAMAMSMSKRDVIKKLMSSGLVIDREFTAHNFMFAHNSMFDYPKFITCYTRIP